MPEQHLGDSLGSLVGNAVKRVRSFSKGKHKQSPSVTDAVLMAGRKAAAIGAGESIKLSDKLLENILDATRPLGSLYGGHVSVVPNLETAKPSYSRISAQTTANQKLPAYDGNDPTIIEMDIINESGSVYRRAIADTGSDDNFINFDTVRRLGLEDKIVDQDTKTGWNGCGDGRFEAMGKVLLTWSSRTKSHKVWDTWFFVIDSKRLDVILGKHFLIESEFLQFDKLALVAHRDNRVQSEAQIREQESKKAKQKRDNEAEKLKRKEKGEEATKGNVKR